MMEKDDQNEWAGLGETLEQPTSSSKKRKQVSEAEKVALELSKLTSKQAQQSKIKFDDGKISFVESSRCPPYAAACTWKDKRQSPCYCSKAEFRFEASLPDRSYLTRYSVTCVQCYDESDTTFHMYCSYCDEILTGSIAGPGGKITDHVITIRHVYKEAAALKAYFDRKGIARKVDLQKAKDYVLKLEQWTDTIRFPKGSLRKSDFDEILASLRLQIQQASVVGDGSNDATGNDPGFSEDKSTASRDNAKDAADCEPYHPAEYTRTTLASMPVRTPSSRVAALLSGRLAMHPMSQIGPQT